MAKERYHLSYELEKRRRKRVAVFCVMFISVFFFIELSLTFLIFPVRQISSSMSPDIVGGSYVLVTPLKKNPERGSVVLLKPLHEERLSALMRIANVACLFFTGQQYSPFTNIDRMGENKMLRRVVGVPGDTIYMRDYVAFIQPAGARHYLTEFELVERAYNVSITVSPTGWDTSVGVSGDCREVTLRDGEYFVLGDDRISSLDSRIFGVARASQIAGRALAVYYPFSRAGRL